MKKIKNKRFYKVISLLIKSIILILSFCYIWQKIKAAEEGINFSELFTSSNLIILLAVCLLMLVNWSLEAAKWKILIVSLEPISFLRSLESVFAGVTASIFTPNRIGEFAGRVFFLEKADKIQATMKSFSGSMAQLLITLFAGLAAVFMYCKLGLNTTNPFKGLNFFYLNLTAVLFIVCLCLLWVSFRNPKSFSVKIQNYLKAFFETKSKELLTVIMLSAIRYFVFSFQYYLILRVFHINIGFGIAMMLIAITFFVTSLIPTFAFTEIAVRGASAVYFFNAVGVNATSIVAASFTVWLINLALPALIGSAFVWKMKFFKE